MKKIFFVLVFIFTVLCTSCIDSGDDYSRIRPAMTIEFYNTNGDHIWGDKLRSKIGNHLENLTIKIIPKDSNLKTEEFPYYFNYLRSGVNVINLPVYGISPDLEEFKLVLINKGEDVFSEDFKIHYNNENSPSIFITKMSIKNSAGKWEEYKPKKIVIKKDNKNTGVFLEVKLG